MPNLVDEIKQRIGATQVELSKYIKIQPIEVEDRKGFVSYGEGNTFPEYNNPGSTYDTMVPERQAYTTSIWLDDSDCCRGKSFEEKYQGNINRCCVE